jgi:hypothetical protein
VDRVGRLVTLGCCIAALAACGAPETATPATTSAVGTTAPPTTTGAPSTTSAPTTTFSARQRDEAEIREIHDRFIDLMAGEPNPDNPDYPAVMTGMQLQRTLEYDRSLLEVGHHLEGSLSSRTLELRFTDRDHVLLRDCTSSTATTVDSSGAVVAHDPAEPWITGLQVLRTDAGWRIADWLTGGDERCVP